MLLSFFHSGILPFRQALLNYLRRIDLARSTDRETIALPLSPLSTKNKNCLSRRKALFCFRREALRRRSFSAAFKEAEPTFCRGAERAFSSEAEPTFARERSELFARATRVNERSELILILILILISTSILTLILISTLISTSLFPSPSIVSPFPFRRVLR